MKKIMAGLSIAIVLLTVGSVILPALVSAADAGWFGLINLTPSITTLSPTGVHSGGPNFTLTVNGTNFVGNSVVRWKDADRTTTYVNSGRLTATILAADIASVGTASVTVFNPAPGGGTSNAVTVTINSKTNTTTTIVSDLPDPSQIGQPITATFTVTATSGTPTGTVTVTDGSVTCSASVAAGNCALTLTIPGTRTLTATYGGDGNFNDSSGTATHTVVGPMYMPFVNRARTSTPTPTPTPTPIANPVRNGGFESENSSSGPWLSAWCQEPCAQNPWNGWETRSNLSGSGASPHTGGYAAWMGGQAGIEMRMDQDAVTVPAGGSILRYWTRVISDEPVCYGPNIDAAWVWFNGHEIDSFALCQGGTATGGWVNRDLNLSAYVGQTGWLTFYIRNLGMNSNWFIDDVAMGTLSGAQFVPYRR